MPRCARRARRSAIRSAVAAAARRRTSPEMPSEGEARVGPATVHWRRDGQGPVIVFLHGFPLSGETWDAVVLELREHFTCVAPDLIGLGQSRSTADTDHSSEGQARAIQEVLGALGVGSYALVGNDTGGWVARELALIDRERVSHLVLTNTEIPGHRPPWVPLYQALAGVPGFGFVLRRLITIPGFLGSSLAFGGCFHDPTRIAGVFHERYVAPLLTSDVRLDGALRFLRCMKFARLDQFRDLHARLTMPTLFLWGTDDPTFPESRARAMAAQFPQVAEFRSLANAKLFFYEEQPREVAESITRFLSGTKG
jgi:haloalkane dehalogenase